MTRIAAVTLFVASMFLATTVAEAAPVDGTGNKLEANGLLQDTGNATIPPIPPKDGRPGFGGRGQGDTPVAPLIHYRTNQIACVTGTRSPGWYDPLLLFAPAPLLASLPGCPGSDASATPPPPSPIDAAYQAWYWQTTLPDPTLATSPPSGAITGLDLYLAIGGPQRLRFDIPALGYDVRLDVTSVYDIDWGEPRPDATPTGRAVTKNHPNQGGLYPTGNLRHQYIERGTATITVTQRWTAAWSAGGQSGTIADRLTTTATRTLPVQEIQAVLTTSPTP